jgi:hypothetical protein
MKYSNITNSKNKNKLTPKLKLKSSSKSNKIIFIVLGVVIVSLIIGILGYFFINNNDNLSDDISITMYYSRGTRDTEKKEQYTFRLNDPIQAKIDFKNATNGEIVNILLVNADNSKIDQSMSITEIPLSDGSGSRFVSLSPLLYKNPGNYKLVVMTVDNDNNQGEQKIIAEREFIIQ